MIPLPDKSVIIIRLDEFGTPIEMATNVDPKMEVIIVTNPLAFKEASAGKPFVVALNEQ